MEVGPLLAFAALAAGASYVQAVAGFAFGLIVMSVVALLHLMPLPEAAATVSALALVNAAQVMSVGWRDVRPSLLLWTLAGALPGLVLGYQLLALLAETRLGVLRLVLGGVIIVSALQLLVPPKPDRRPSRPALHLLFGALAGVMGGLFSAPGPPVVWHLWRQPLPTAAIRRTLVGVFGVLAILRIGLVASDPAASESWLLRAVVAAPAVWAGAWLARRAPPPLPDPALRRVVFALLSASGVALALPPLLGG